MEKVLHIFGQQSYHDEVRVMGTKTALLILRDAISAAIDMGRATSQPVFVNDGEGYYVEVECVPSEEADALDQPYIFLDVEYMVNVWRQRSFAAEAELHRLRHEHPTNGKPHG